MNRAERYFAQKASNLLSNKEAFYQWLKSLPFDQIVGYARQAKSCPLVGFAKSAGFPVEEITFNHFDISFGGSHSFAVMGVSKDGYEEDGIDETPYWFSDFVQIVDRIYEKGHPVSAKSAIAILDSLNDPILKYSPEQISLKDILHLETEGR
jgi:hypothetical protein